MNIVRWEIAATDTAEFTVDYGGKRARIKLEDTGVAGIPEEDGIAWEPFYRERMKELFDAILAEDTVWTSRSVE